MVPKAEIYCSNHSGIRGPLDLSTATAPDRKAMATEVGHSTGTLWKPGAVDGWPCRVAGWWQWRLKKLLVTNCCQGLGLAFRHHGELPKVGFCCGEPSVKAQGRVLCSFCPFLPSGRQLSPGCAAWVEGRGGLWDSVLPALFNAFFFFLTAAV